MKPIQTTLYHRVLFPEHPVTENHPAVLFLHGRGADEEDLLDIAPMLDERFLIISARAPYAFSGGGYTWYDTDAIGSPHRDMFEESYQKLSIFLDDVSKGYPVRTDRIVLFGFSMGTVLSYALALTHPDMIRAVAANSGYLPEGTTLPYRWEDLGQTDFFITHGVSDPVIPVALARRARDLMMRSTATVIYREYPVLHTLGEQALADVLTWTRTFLE
jgi:phospholipase/carboxylesterase